MKHVFDTVTNANTGRVIEGATVTVYDSNGSLATLYSDNSGATTTNPVLTNENGLFDFYVADGTYSLVIAYGDTSVTVSDVEIYDSDTMDDQADRAVKVPTGETGITLPALADRADKLMGFDSSGDPVAITNNAGVVSITDSPYNADKTGVVDATSAIQAALDSGATAVYVPEGSYLVNGPLVMPNVKNFILYGCGTASKLIQGTGGKLITWDTSAVYYMQGVIRDLYFEGTNGTDHVIDTSGVGGLTLKNLYIKDVPVGNSAIHVDGAAATQTHDIRIIDCQIYSNTAGKAGIYFGSLAADSSVSQFIMNGNNVTNYCIYLSGALAITFEDMHPYNAGAYVVYGMGGSGATFTNCVLDRGVTGIVYFTGYTDVTYSACYFEAVQTSQIGVNLVSSSHRHTFTNCRFGVRGSDVATSMVVSDSSCNSVRAFATNPTAISSWTTPFNLQGTTSYDIGTLGRNPLSERWSVSGVATSAQAQNSTNYLGVNGLQSTSGATVYVTPYDGKLVDVFVAVDTTPASGQTFTFTVYVNGSTTGSSGTISNGSFNTTITLDLTVSAGDRVSIRSVFSATSGSATPRWAMRFLG